MNKNRHVRIRVDANGRLTEVVKKEGKETDDFLKKAKKKWQAKMDSWVDAKVIKLQEEWKKNNKLVVTTEIIKDDK